MKLRMTLSEGGRLLSEGGKLYLGFFARRVCSCMWMSDDHARDVDETQWSVCDDDMWISYLFRAWEKCVPQ